LPINTPQVAPARVLAMGAYFKNRVCLIDGERVLWSPIHGDLDNAANCIALEQSVDELLAASSGPLDAVAHDLHPDFHSTRVALALADEHGISSIAVQHHHAHIAVTLAEQGFIEPVIGLALDGTGLGDDDKAWGGELLWLSEYGAAHHYRRVDHLALLAMPGGDAAARESWRLAAAMLHALGHGEEIMQRFSPLVGEPAARTVHTLLLRGLHCPLTSSAGRWFDAAAAALRLNTHQTFEAEAAIVLEGSARRWLERHPDFQQPWTSLDLSDLFNELFLLGDQGELAQARGAAMFHLALANGLAQAATLHAKRLAVHTVVLGGGCFVNRVLREQLTSTLIANGLRVIAPQQAGCGDAGIALGQAWVAAQTLLTRAETELPFCCATNREN
jgi:hydrogenase maturation protein HypF